MLSIYRRHRPKCKFAEDRASKKCRCSLWATGTLEGQPYRKSLKTRSFERAEQIKRQIEDGNHPEKKGITVNEALTAFIEDCRARNLSSSTFKKYQLLSRRFQSYLLGRAVHTIREVSVDTCRDFRATRKLSPRTGTKEIERLRCFFTFCISNNWLTTNPAKSIKAPQVKTLPRIPFDEKEIQTILSKAKDERELAFLLLLRHTGLRIGDASLLKSSQVSQSRVFLYTTKAGVPISILIPDNLVALLTALATKGGYFFLRGESTSMHTTADLWRRRIKILCKEAKVMPDHPHRFRHSLAADLLTKGATVEQVAAILGNSPAVVIKHYSQWIKSRQDALDTMIEKTWEKPKLALVKK